MVYQHYKGGTYQYITCGKLESRGDDSSEFVVYQSLKDGKVWIRPIEEWKEKFHVLA